MVNVNIKSRIFFLSSITQIEYMSAVMIALTSMIIIPPVIFLSPLTLVGWFFSDNEPIPKELRIKIQSIVKFPKLTLYRFSKRDVFTLFQIPFITILLIPKLSVDELDDKLIQAQVLHEFGHTKQFDVTVLIWLILSAIIWVRLFLSSVISLIQKKYWVYQGHENSDILNQTALYWLFSFFVLSAIILYQIRSILHRREFLADAIASNMNKGLIQNLLQHQTRKSVFVSSKHWVDSLLNKFTHPLFSKRLNAVSGQTERWKTVIFKSSLLCGFLCNHAIILTSLPKIENDRLELFDFSLPIVTFATFVMFIYYMAVRLTKSQHTNIRDVFSFVSGIFIGMSLSWLSVSLLEISLVGIQKTVLLFNIVFVFGLLVSVLSLCASAALLKRYSIPNIFWPIEGIMYLGICFSLLAVLVEYLSPSGDLQINFTELPSTIYTTLIFISITLCIVIQMILTIIANRIASKLWQAAKSLFVGNL